MRLRVVCAAKTDRWLGKTKQVARGDRLGGEDRWVAEDR